METLRKPPSQAIHCRNTLFPQYKKQVPEKNPLKVFLATAPTRSFRYTKELIGAPNDLRHF